MKTTNTFKKRFLTNTTETGRIMVISKQTGIQYFVEHIYEKKAPKLWGDYNPTNKKMEGNYGHKYTGAITQEESMILPENGMKNITLFRGSPYAEIDRRDREYQKKQLLRKLIAQ